MRNQEFPDVPVWHDECFLQPRVKRMIQEMITETVSKKLFTVDEFYRLSEVGLLPEDRHFELIRGEIIEMPIPGSPHSGNVKRVLQEIYLKLGNTVIIGVQDPLSIDRLSLPMPDITVAKRRADFYKESHPTAADVLFVVEVSHTTASYDKNIKAPLYAEAGVPEYWQLDVSRGVLIVRTDPRDGDYRNTRILEPGQTVSPELLPDATFSIDELLG